MTPLRLARVSEHVIACGAAVAAVACCVVSGSACAAARSERWIATSDTAIAVTGNISVSARKIGFYNGTSLILSSPHRVDSFGGNGEVAQAFVYRLAKPIDLRLKNGNHLCGSAGASKAVRFIVIWRPAPLPGDKAPRALAAFAGDKAPGSSSDPGNCGVYNYEAR